ncbi:hypothetical protein XBKQ1_930002 [Xenorhabdus bovienii str. kraussei Quebec]|uniref:Uncharacterized protein n=1 Tax=Xenorhabdus bovienii str. kraussei Quebec TaxID=1398203 RepID=A0A077PC84_XENBV|nr:hypothetical protein XBKQ1_930002 [Xenorhabdus bovienii str. kraussei Quebec]
MNFKYHVKIYRIIRLISCYLLLYDLLSQYLLSLMSYYKGGISHL